MKLEDNFNQALEEWRAHASKKSHSSIIKDYLDCEGYRKIVSLGKSALPLIRKAYDSEPDNSSLSWLLNNAVSEIAGNSFSIPEEIRGNISEMQNYTKNWLDTSKILLM